MQLNKYVLDHIPVPRPSVRCGQFILCPFVQYRREGDFQAQVESLFAKEGRTLAVLSPHGDSSSFNVDFWVSLIRCGRVIALYISLPMSTWNPLQGSPQQVRSMREIWSVSGLALAPFKCVRAANFSVQASLILMLAARAARVPALWCHTSPVEGELSPSLWHLPEVQWILKAEAFDTDRLDSCAFGCKRRDPVTVMSTNLPSVAQTVGSHPTCFQCVCQHQHSSKSGVGRTSDDTYEGLVAMLARCVCWDIGLFSNNVSRAKCELSQLDNDQLECQSANSRHRMGTTFRLAVHHWPAAAILSSCRHEGSTPQRTCGGSHEQTSVSQRRVTYQHCLHVPLWQEPVHVSTLLSGVYFRCAQTCSLPFRSFTCPRKTCPLPCKWYQCPRSTPAFSPRGPLCLHVRVHSLAICVCAHTVLVLSWKDGLFTFVLWTEPASARPHLLLEASSTGCARPSDENVCGL